MEYYAGIDVSVESSCICVVDGNGKVVREAKALSEPEALIGWFRELGINLANWDRGRAIISMALFSHAESGASGGAD